MYTKTPIMARTRRHVYTESKRFDTSCRSHGGCPWCEGNRLKQQRMREAQAEYSMTEWDSGDDTD